MACAETTRSARRRAPSFGFWLTLGVWAAGCVSSIAAPPRPAALDRVPALPEPVSEVPPGQSLAVLTPAAGHASALALVRTLFDAIAHESITELADVFSPDALATLPAGSNLAALGYWTRRFAVLDYRGLEADLLAPPEAISVFDAADAQRLRHQRDLKLQPDGVDELLVVVPVRSTSTTRSLFGPELQLVVTRAPEGTFIRQMYEDFTLR